MSAEKGLGKIVDDIWEIVFGTKETTKPKRARKKGRYVADDPATKNVNEAWVGGRAPRKKRGT
jgi:hypothetical protein